MFRWIFKAAERKLNWEFVAEIFWFWHWWFSLCMKLLVREWHRTGQEQHGGVRSEEEKEQENHQGDDALVHWVLTVKNSKWNTNRLPKASDANIDFCVLHKRIAWYVLNFIVLFLASIFSANPWARPHGAGQRRQPAEEEYKLRRFQPRYETWLVAHYLWDRNSLSRCAGSAKLSRVLFWCVAPIVNAGGAALMNFMGNTMKNEITRVISSIMVLSCFGEFHGKYHENWDNACHL